MAPVGVIEAPRVQLKNGLCRTKKGSTSLPMTRAVYISRRTPNVSSNGGSAEGRCETKKKGIDKPLILAGINYGNVRASCKIERGSRSDSYSCSIRFRFDSRKKGFCKRLLPNSGFCLSRLRGKNPQKVGNLLSDIRRIAGQPQVRLCGQFGSPISIFRNETCRPTIVRRGVLRKFRHLDSLVSYPGNSAPPG